MLQTESKKQNKRILTSAIVFVALVVLDQITKAVIRANVALSEYIPLLGDFLGITYHQNTGAAFGSFQGATIILAVISALFAAGCVFLLLKPKFIPQLATSWGTIGLVLFIAGAIGNLIDRVSLGFVTDWIHLGPIPNFNVADSCVTFAVIIIIFFVLLPELFKKEDKNA